jgi:hypothetical protein
VPELVDLLRMVFGRRLRIGTPDDDEHVPVEIMGSHVEQLAGQLAGFGAGLRIEDPPEVVARLRQIGEELVSTYG